MSEPERLLKSKSLTTPRAAAVAGILFAILYGTGLVLIRLAIPADSTADGGAWLETNARAVDLALNLVPYAGIAFLWFIGVIRDRLGNVEDRFFATVFLGSGLLFLALTFAGAAMAGGLLTSRKRRIHLWPRGDVSHHQRVCRPHGGRVHDFSEHYLDSHRLDAPRLGLRYLCPGVGVAGEYRLFPVGVPDLPQLGVRGQWILPVA